MPEELVETGFVFNWALILHVLVVTGVSLRLIGRRRPVGDALAWFSVVVAFPLLGVLAYGFFGEVRVGERRMRRLERLLPRYAAWIEDFAAEHLVEPGDLETGDAGLHVLGQRAMGVPPVGGNDLELLTDAAQCFTRMIADIDGARTSVHMEFYIWDLGGLPDQVAEAVERAARRGVTCRVLVDALGSFRFLRSGQARRLRKAGAHIVAALPSGVLKALLARLDHRIHRKIAVIDGKIAYTGSLNVIDPSSFGLEAGAGPWVDAMTRVRGPAAAVLGATFMMDWQLETGEGLEELRASGLPTRSHSEGRTAVQVAPSGPAPSPQGLHQMLLTAVYAARRELVITTPYFVPSEAMMTALGTAARRGVDVVLIVPARVDSVLVRYASRAHFGELLALGVRILAYEGGLLHAKTMTIDGETSVFGSVNFDMRSFWLNYEISLFVYERAFTTELRRLQEVYVSSCRELELDSWRRRSAVRRFAENAVQLLAPLL